MVLARLLCTQARQLTPLSEVRNTLSEVVDRVERERERVVITRHGRAAAVLTSVDELESIEETLELLSDPELMAGWREARAEPHDDRQVMTKEQALQLVRRDGGG